MICIKIGEGRHFKRAHTVIFVTYLMEESEENHIINTNRHKQKISNMVR